MRSITKTLTLCSLICLAIPGCDDAPVILDDVNQIDLSIDDDQEVQDMSPEISLQEDQANLPFDNDQVGMDQEFIGRLKEHALEHDNGLTHEGPCLMDEVGSPRSMGKYCYSVVTNYNYLGGGWYEEVGAYCCDYCGPRVTFRVFCPGGSGCED